MLRGPLAIAPKATLRVGFRATAPCLRKVLSQWRNLYDHVRFTQDSGLIYLRRRSGSGEKYCLQLLERLFQNSGAVGCELHCFAHVPNASARVPQCREEHGANEDEHWKWNLPIGASVLRGKCDALRCLLPGSSP